MSNESNNMLTADDLDNLRHAVGFRNGKPPKAPYRNHYHTAGDDPSFVRLVAHGFARLARRPSVLTGGDSVFAVTTEGLRAIGCTPKFIRDLESMR